MNDDELEARLGEGLDRRAGRLDGGSLTLGTVQRRARTIRRNRRLAGAAGVLATAAVVVPVVLHTSLAGPHTSEPLPATQSPDPEGVSGVAYLEKDTLHLPDGTSRQLNLPKQALAFAVLSDGRVVVETSGPDYSLVVRVVDGTDVSAAYPASDTSALVVNQGGSGVAWITPDGVPYVVQSGRAEPVQLSRVPGGTPRAAALLGEDCTTDPETVEGGGCSVVASSDDGAFVSSSHGLTAPFEDERAVRVSDVDSGGLAGRATVLTKITDFGACSAVYDLTTARETGKNCDYATLQFSPEGGRLLGFAPGDGLGPTRFSILDSQTLAQIAVFDPPATTVVQWAWEDEDHVLAVLVGDGTSRLVRVGLDGTAQTLASSIPLDETSPDFLLATTP